MSGFGRQERLQQERRLKRATEAVESVIDVTAPLAKSIEALNQRQETMSGRIIAAHDRLTDAERDIAAVGDKLTDLSRSFWVRLRWLVTGRMQ